MKIIGIAGTNGSGKDTVGEIIEKEHNFLFVSVTELLREELHRRRESISRQNLSGLSAEWRGEFGLGVLVDKALAKFNQASKKFDGLAMASLRNVGEVERLHELGGQLVWIDADPKTRYDRIQNANRGRTGEDNKTYAEFLAEEAAEMHPADPNNPSLLNVAAVKILADIFIENIGTMDLLEEKLAGLFGSF